MLMDSRSPVIYLPWNSMLTTDQSQVLLGSLLVTINYICCATSILIYNGHF